MKKISMKLLFSFLLWSVSITSTGGIVPSNNMDTYDIWLQLFDDDGCKFPNEDMLLTTNNCYANRFNFPADKIESLGYSFAVTIVSFYNTSSTDVEAPVKINIDYYTDVCNTRQKETLQIMENECSGLIDRPVFATFHGMFTLKHRAKTCDPAESFKCSPIKLAYNQFFRDSTCQGVPYLVFQYPVQRECIRYSNGTQMFYQDPQNDDYLIEVDYPHSPDCTENSIGCESCVVPLRFSIKRDFCYELSESSYFSWTESGGAGDQDEEEANGENPDPLFQSDDGEMNKVACTSIWIVWFLVLSI